MIVIVCAQTDSSTPYERSDLTEMQLVGLPREGDHLVLPSLRLVVVDHIIIEADSDPIVVAAYCPADISTEALAIIKTVREMLNE